MADRQTLLAEYKAELERTLGREVSVTMVNRRVEVQTVADAPPGRYTLATIQKALGRLKLRPTANKI